VKVALTLKGRRKQWTWASGRFCKESATELPCPPDCSATMWAGLGANRIIL
jgi:hypothetical protein